MQNWHLLRLLCLTACLSFWTHPHTNFTSYLKTKFPCKLCASERLCVCLQRHFSHARVAFLLDGILSTVYTSDPSWVCVNIMVVCACKWASVRRGARLCQTALISSPLTSVATLTPRRARRVRRLAVIIRTFLSSASTPLLTTSSPTSVPSLLQTDWAAEFCCGRCAVRGELRREDFLWKRVQQRWFGVRFLADSTFFSFIIFWGKILSKYFTSSRQTDWGYCYWGHLINLRTTKRLKLQLGQS